MSGDVHVRFCERLGGRFPGATRLIITGVSAALLADEVQPLVERFLMEHPVAGQDPNRIYRDGLLSRSLIRKPRFDPSRIVVFRSC